MGRELALALLGSLYIELDGKRLELTGQKALALLVYLAVTQKPHTREALSTLLWGETEEDRAKASLRTALWKLRRELVSFISADRQHVAFDFGAPHWVDLQEFGDLILNSVPNANDTTLPSTTLTPARVSALVRATSLYQGDFLAGFDVIGAPGFDDWVLRIREWARDLATTANYQLAAHYRSTGEYRSALDYVTKLLLLAPWQEEAHRQRMCLLALCGQRNAALAQYHTCCSTLAKELNVEPMAETRELYQRIKTGRPLEDEQHHPTQRRLHGTTWHPSSEHRRTDTVGREQEIAQLKEMLLAEDNRLTTIVGPPGVGKTHLSLATAEQVAKFFKEGVWYIPLETNAAEPHAMSRLRAPPLPPFLEDDVLRHISRALGFTYTADLSFSAQLLHHLRYREVLLIFNGSGASPSRTQLVRTILRHTRRTRVLMISESPLGIDDERVLQLNPLIVPEPAEIEALAQDDAHALTACTSVRFFCDRARLRLPDFELTSRNRSAVARICALAQGLPLGIKMAAAWTGHVPLADIAHGISSNLRPSSAPVAKYEEQRESLSAVFAFSWRQLSPQRQDTLARLTLFNCHFSADAAQRVLGVSSVELDAIARTALLQQTIPGRYTWHPHVRRLVLDRAQRTPAKTNRSHLNRDRAQLERQHAAYYLGLLIQRGADLASQRAKDAARDVRTDWPHIRKAWTTAVRDNNIDLLDQSLDGLLRYLHLQNWLCEARGLLDHAADSIAQQVKPANHVRTDIFLGRVHNARAWVHNTQQHYKKAIMLAEETTEIAARYAALTDPHHTAEALLAAGNVEWGRGLCGQGAPDEARGKLNRALGIARRIGHQDTEASSLLSLGVVELQHGDINSAEDWLTQAQLLYGQLDDHLGRHHALIQLSKVATRRQAYAEARRRAEEALALTQLLGDWWGESEVLIDLGRIACAEGMQSEAITDCERALQISRDVGNRQMECEALTELAYLHLHGQKTEAAWRSSLLAVQLADELGSPGDEAHAWLAVGHAFLAANRLHQAIQAYQQALRLENRIGEKLVTIGALAGLCQAYLHRGEIAPAQILVEHILVHLNAIRETTPREVDRIYITCYQVLEAAGDSRARQILHKASCDLGYGSQR